MSTDKVIPADKALEFARSCVGMTSVEQVDQAWTSFLFTVLGEASTESTPATSSASSSSLSTSSSLAESPAAETKSEAKKKSSATTTSRQAKSSQTCSYKYTKGKMMNEMCGVGLAANNTTGFCKKHEKTNTPTEASVASGTAVSTPPNEAKSEQSEKKRLSGTKRKKEQDGKAAPAPKARKVTDASATDPTPSAAVQAAPRAKFIIKKKKLEKSGLVIYIHEDTQLVFSKTDRKVIGRFHLDTEEVIPLTEEDQAECKKNNFQY